MKRVRVEVEVTRHTSLEFEVEDDTDTEDIKATALDEAEWSVRKPAIRM
jgi:hypothetical protein